MDKRYHKLTVCSGNGYYKVLSNGDVTYHHPADKTITSAVVPNQVKKGKFLFKVIKVSNYAFDGCENLLWIVIHSIPFLHPGLERETNRVFYFSCRHHLPSLLLYVLKKTHSGKHYRCSMLLIGAEGSRRLRMLSDRLCLSPQRRILGFTQNFSPKST